MKAKNSIVLMGMKSCGKTTVGKKIADLLCIDFFDIDKEIEKLYTKKTNKRLPFREIYQRHGKEYFRELETDVLHKKKPKKKNVFFVLAIGGGTLLSENNRKTLKLLGTNVFLDLSEEILLQRIISNGIPAFFPYPKNPKKSLSELLKIRKPLYTQSADITIKITTETPSVLAKQIASIIKGETHGN